MSYEDHKAKAIQSAIGNTVGNPISSPIGNPINNSIVFFMSVLTLQKLNDLIEIFPWHTEIIF